MKRTLLILVTAAVGLLHVRSENVLGDSFSYPNGAIVGALGSPWLNNSGAAGTMLATNSTLEINASRAEDIVAPLSRTISTNVGDVAAYASFNVRFIGLPTTNGTYFAHFTGTTINSFFRGRVLATLTNAVLGKYRLSIGNSSGVSPATGLWPSDLDTNVTYKIVTRYELATGLSKMWIDPILESDPSVTATDAPNAGDIVYYSFRQAAGEGVSRVDDLRVGTSFNDVAGTNSPPTISSIGSINIPASTSTGPIAFVVADSETPAASLTLSSTSSNPTLLPTNNIVFGGSGVNRTVTITPVAGQEGSSTVGISVTDGPGASATTTFTVKVGAPSISNISNQATPTNTPLTGIAFTVTDAETPNGLTVTATSTNTALIPDVNIAVLGSGANRTLSITPVANQAGISLITVSVTDGIQTNSDTFVVTVFPVLGVLINEPFSYADGTHIADGSTLWISHSGTFGQTVVNGGKVSLTQTNDEDFNREFPALTFGPNSGVILYASFKVQFSTPPSSGGDYFAHYKDDGTFNFRARTFASAQGAPSGQFRIGVANGAGSVSTNALHPTFLSTNVTYTVVTRFNVGTEETTLWINPTSEGSANVSATDSAAPFTAFSFALRQTGGIGVFTLDDLKVGTQFTDVATVVPSFSLRTVRSGIDVVVIWPVAASGFVLQSATDLTASNWVNVGTSPTVVGSENFITNTAPTGNAFFRLKN
jgi:hypothetical protein